MSLKLDLGNMKHVRSDEKTTTLKHPHGHEITLHHNVLSKPAQAQLKALSDAARSETKEKLADGGSVAKKTGDTGHAPASNPEQYDQSLSNGVKNIKDAFGFATGGQVNKHHGVHNQDEDGVQGRSKAGHLVNQNMSDEPKENKVRNAKAKDEHSRVLGEMKAQKKPNIQGLAEGGQIGNIGKENYSQADKPKFCAYCGSRHKEDEPQKFAQGTTNTPVEGEEPPPESNEPQAAALPTNNEPEEQQQDPNDPAIKQELAQASDQQELDAAKNQQASLAPDDNRQPQSDASANPSASDPNQAPPQPPVAPQTAAGMEQPPANPIQQYKNDVQNEIHQEGLAYQADRTNGHIDSPSAEKMFHDKSTLGKLGTLFSLMVGGAGAGLSHQPNLAYQAMQNQLDRDFKAQTVSAENAQNYFRLNQQNLANQAGIGKTKAETDIMAAANARIQMNWDGLNKLTEENAKLPEGSPQRRNGDQVLAVLNDQIQKGNYSISAQAASAAATARALGLTAGGKGSTGMGAGASGSQISNMKLMGPMGEKRAAELENKTINGIPEVAGQMANRNVTEGDRKEITAMKTLDDKGKDLFNFINQYKGMNINRLDPKVRAVAEQKVEELKNFYNSSIGAGALTEGRLAWYDKQFGKGAPTDPLPQMLGQTDRLHEMVNSNATRMSTNLKSMGFNPKASSHSQQYAPASSPDEVVQVDKTTNKPAVFNAKTKQFIRWGK